MDKQILEKLRKAGSIAATVRREGAARLVDGASYLEVMDYCEKRITHLGGHVTWAQMSTNSCAAHFCPKDDCNLTCKEGDVIKIDIGVDIDGWIADNAMTVEVGSTLHTDMIKASQNALKSAIKLVEPGRAVCEIGEAIFSEADALGFRTIKNLGGHTLERFKTHGGVFIPLYNNGDKTELEENWQIAIEPFVTDGIGLIKESGESTVFMAPFTKPVRSLYARKILPRITSYQGLPFTTRWLTREFGPTALLGLKDLSHAGILRSYPPLVEVSSKLVTQFEHSMVVGKTKPFVYTRHEDDSW